MNAVKVDTEVLFPCLIVEEPIVKEEAEITGDKGFIPEGML